MSRAVRGGIWTAGSRIVAQGSQFLIFLVAVRILSPAEFGLFALVTAWTMIAAQVSMAGWPEYVMQWTGGPERPREVLTVSLLAGVAIAALAYAASRLVPGLSPDGRTLVQLLGLSIPFVSVGAVYAGILNWQDRLTTAALTAGICDTLNMVVAVIALRNGYDVLSLAFGRIASALVWFVLGAMAVRMAPALTLDGRSLAEMARFSVQIIVVRLMTTFRLYAATLVIGTLLGATEAGYFRAAQRLAAALTEIIGEPTRVLTWSLFRAERVAQDGGIDFRARANSFYAGLATLSLPLFLVMALLAEEIVAVVFGDGWDPVVRVLPVLAAAHAILVVSSTSEAIMSLAGRVRILPWITLVFALVSVGLAFLAAPFGMVAIAWSQVCAAAIAFVVNAAVQHRYAGVRWGQIARRLGAVLPGLVAMWLADLGLTRLPPVAEMAPVARILLLGCILLLVFTVTVLALDPRLRAQARAALLRRRP